MNEKTRKNITRDLRNRIRLCFDKKECDFIIKNLEDVLLKIEKNENSQENRSKELLKKIP